MGREVSTEIVIDAPAEVVWRELTNFAKHAEWNPFIKSIAGECSHGAKLAVTVCPPGGKPMHFKPVLKAFEPNRKLVWQGRLLMPGIFDGEHSFELHPQGERQTRFVHKENFSGILVPMFWSTLDRDTRAGFVKMNEALKARCEGK